MGWTSFPMHKPVKEWFKEEWGNDYEVVDSALVNRSTLYGAIKKKSTGLIFCAVFLIRWSRSEYNFSYKDMSEFSGPSVINCPQRIIKLLSPLNDENDPNGWAREWRKKVEDFHQKRNTIKKSKDKIFKTTSPVNFTNGCSYQYFKKIGRTLIAGILCDNNFEGRCRVRLNLSDFDFELIKID